ncbi:hypothetical protein, partial [Chromobacterium amazonense]|uniref:hypothetical protein n=1 Tax=Chromobacterium amazonense TaxID=1382803 RepID=UPI003F79CB91
WTAVYASTPEAIGKHAKNRSPSLEGDHKLGGDYQSEGGQEEGRTRLEALPFVEPEYTDPTQGKLWHIEKNKDIAAFPLAFRDLPNGGRVYVWVKIDSDMEKYAKQAKYLADQFADHVYPLELSLLGPHWGSLDNPEAQKEFLPANYRDIHIVATTLDEGVNGFVSFYDRRAKTLSKKNRAHVIYLRLDYVKPEDEIKNPWHGESDLAARAVGTMAHEFAHMIFAYHKLVRSWQPNESAYKNERERETWEEEFFAQTAAYLVAAERFPRGLDSAGQTHPFFRRNGYFQAGLNSAGCRMDGWDAAACYGKAGLLGALMIHRYGHGILKDWLQSEKFGVEALNEAIQKNGGVDYFDLKERFAGVAMLAGGKAAVPERYAFPVREVQVGPNVYMPHPRRYALPEVHLSKFSVSWNQQENKQALDVERMMISRLNNTLTVPANGSLTLLRNP